MKEAIQRKFQQNEKKGIERTGRDEAAGERRKLARREDAPQQGGQIDAENLVLLSFRVGPV